MIVPLVAAGATMFYLAAVPVKLAFALRAGEQGGWGAGVSVFEGRFAGRAARRRIQAAKKPRPQREISYYMERLELLKSALKAGRYALKHMELDALTVRGTIGLGDAALTAVACGALSGFCQAVAAATGAKLEGGLQPDFSAPQIALSGEITGIVTLRAGHIIFAALIGAIDYGNGRLSQWIDTRSKTS